MDVAEKIVEKLTPEQKLKMSAWGLKLYNAFVAFNNWWYKVTRQETFKWNGVSYPIDEWPGYDVCWRPGCGHYRCEHDVHLGPIIYIKPGTEQKTELPVENHPGCDNAGCECPGFMTQDELLQYVHDNTYAATEAYYELRKLKGVARVEVDVRLVVSVNTVFDDIKAWNEGMMPMIDAEKKLQDAHAPVNYNFTAGFRKY